MKKSWLVGLGVGLAVGLVITGTMSVWAATSSNFLPAVTTGCGPTPDPRILDPVNGAVAQRLVSGQVAFTIYNVSRMSKLGDSSPKAGFIYLVIEQEIENLGREKFYVSGGYNEKVKDSAGLGYSNPFVFGQTGLQPFPGGDLRPGDKARGQVVWEVRTNAAGLMLIYTFNPYATYDSPEFRVPLP